MSLAPNDPLATDSRHPSPPSNVRVGLLVIAFSLLAATIYFLYTNSLYQDEPKALEASIEQVFVQDPVPINLDSPPTIKIPPLNVDAVLIELTANPLPPLPPFEKANVFIKAQVGEQHWQALNINAKNLPALNKDFLLQRSVAFLDGLSKGVLQDKLLPFTRPSQAFIAHKQGQALSMGSVNFQRYDAFSQSIVAIDSQQAAAFFHWTRPLLETAYSELGYPGENLDGAIIKAIDTLLATPRVEGPIALKRESVLYQYADPAIEALPSAQKQLLRMGSKNSALLKSWLSELRSALLTTGQDQ